MRLFFRGLGLALPLLLMHVACGGDDGGGGGSVTPGTDSGPGDPQTNPGADGGNDGATNDSGPTPDPPIATITNETLDVAGTPRTYTLAVPVSYDASKKYKLVFELHGDGEDGPGMQKKYPFEATSKQDAIVAYPNGGGNPGWILYTAPESNPDFAFLQALVTSLAGKYNIDTDKVLGFGYSSGAFMVNQVGCKSTLFRAIAPNEGGAPSDDSSGNARNCNNPNPLAVFAFHGDADTVVDVGSGQFETKFWAQHNGCSAQGRENIDPAPCVAATNCDPSKAVTYCEIAGQGHVVWNRAAEVAWKYLGAL